MSGKRGRQARPSPCKAEPPAGGVFAHREDRACPYPAVRSWAPSAGLRKENGLRPIFSVVHFFWSNMSHGQKIRGLAKELIRPITTISCWCTEIASLLWLLNPNHKARWKRTISDTLPIFPNAGKIAPALNQFQSCHDQSWKFNFFAAKTSILKMSGARLLIFWQLTDRLATTSQLTASPVV